MTNTEKTRTDILRTEIALSWDGGDPWGSALSALGGVCDVLHFIGGDIPASTGYVPSAFGPDLESYPSSLFLELYRDGFVGQRELEYWARVLDRAADLVPEACRY